MVGVQEWISILGGTNMPVLSVEVGRSQSVVVMQPAPLMLGPITPLRLPFKRTCSQIPVIERAIETAALILGSDRSRGYCLEMICADFLAGANPDNRDPETLLFSITRFFKFLPPDHKQAFLKKFREEAA